MDAAFSYVFPAIRGVQAGREYYVSMCPMRLLPKIFLFNEAELVPELRAQRVLNRARLPEMAEYVLKNPRDYCFSAITASVDGNLAFEAIGPGAEGQRIGLLHIPMSAQFIINDGQHRRAAIEMALRENPDLADESIAVVLFHDQGLQRCQQMFADLNRHAIRPSTSLGILYDYRDDDSKTAKTIALKSPVFRDVIETERSTLSLRSRKLFTLSALYQATIALLENTDGTIDEKTTRATEFWEEIAKQFKEWQLVRDNKMHASELRKDFIHSHGIVLHALGRMGNALLRDDPNGWRRRLKRLKQIDWSRSNSRVWEGRAMIGGRVQKGNQNVVLTTNVIKQRMGLALSPEEYRLEEAIARGERASD